MKFDTAQAKASIFARIRANQERSPASRGEERLLAQAHIGSCVRGPQPLPVSDLLACFETRSIKMSSTVARVSDAGAIGPEIVRYLSVNGLPLNAVIWPALQSEPWAHALAALGLQVRCGAPAGDDLVGISGVAAAIAETGTLMMCSGPDTPASMHLLPETHIAIVRESEIVMTMEDAFQRRRQTGQPLPRALNLVSGPSRTGDIEQTIVLGAHGPYRVHIVILTGH